MLTGVGLQTQLNDDDLEEIRSAMCLNVVEDVERQIGMYAEEFDKREDPLSAGLELANVIERALLFGIMDINFGWDICEHICKKHKIYVKHLELMQYVGLPRTNIGKFGCFIRLILVETGKFATFLKHLQLKKHAKFMKSKYHKWSIVLNEKHLNRILALFINNSKQNEVQIEIPIDFENLDSISYEMNRHGFVVPCKSKSNALDAYHAHDSFAQKKDKNISNNCKEKGFATIKINDDNNEMNNIESCEEELSPLSQLNENYDECNNKFSSDSEYDISNWNFSKNFDNFFENKKILAQHLERRPSLHDLKRRGIMPRRTCVSSMNNYNYDSNNSARKLKTENKSETSSNKIKQKRRKDEKRFKAIFQQLDLMKNEMTLLRYEKMHLKKECSRLAKSHYDLMDRMLVLDHECEAMRMDMNRMQGEFSVVFMNRPMGVTWCQGSKTLHGKEYKVVKVGHVEANSLAQLYSIESGDVLISVNNENIENVEIGVGKDSIDSRYDNLMCWIDKICPLPMILKFRKKDCCLELERNIYNICKQENELYKRLNVSGNERNNETLSDDGESSDSNVSSTAAGAGSSSSNNKIIKHHHKQNNQMLLRRLSSRRASVGNIVASMLPPTMVPMDGMQQQEVRTRSGANATQKGIKLMKRKDDEMDDSNESSDSNDLNGANIEIDALENEMKLELERLQKCKKSNDNNLQYNAFQTHENGGMRAMRPIRPMTPGSSVSPLSPMSPASRTSRRSSLPSISSVPTGSFGSAPPNGINAMMPGITGMTGMTPQMRQFAYVPQGPQMQQMGQLAHMGQMPQGNQVSEKSQKSRKGHISPNANLTNMPPWLQQAPHAQEMTRTMKPESKPKRFFG